MTEIPEHLRKRAEEARKRAAGESSGDAMPAHLRAQLGSSYPTRVPEHLLERAKKARAAIDHQDDGISAELASPDTAQIDPVAVTQENPTAPVNDGYSDVKLGLHSTWVDILVGLVVLVPLSFLASGVVIFIYGFLAQQSGPSFLDMARIIYILVGTAFVLFDTFGALFVSYRAHKLRVPYKAYLVAVRKYKLNKQPDFKEWDGERLLEVLKLKGSVHRLAGVIARAVGEGTRRF